MSLTPDQIAQQQVAPIVDLSTGRMIGVAYGHDRIIARWKPEQADELEAMGRLMIELAAELRQVREAGEGDGGA